MGEQPKKTDVKSSVELGDGDKTQAFFRAVKEENIAVMKELLEAKVEFTHNKASLLLALFDAVRKPDINPTIVQILLDVKADPSAYKHILNGVNNADVISMLIAGKAVVDVGTLHFAASNGKVDALKILIDGKADVNAVDDRGNTALHHAVNNAQHQAITFLLEAKANLRAKNNEGSTPLLMVAKSRYVERYESLKLLLEAKAQVNAVDNQGITALHWVVRPKADHGGVAWTLGGESMNKEITAVVNILLEAKADRSMRAHVPRSTISTAASAISPGRGKTAYEYASENGYTDLDNLFPLELTLGAGLHPRAGARSVVAKVYDNRRTGMSELHTIGLICKFGRGKPTPVKEPVETPRSGVDLTV